MQLLIIFGVMLGGFVTVALVIGALVIGLGQKAVSESEAAIRARFDAAGEQGAAARKLMRDAGYNV